MVEELLGLVGVRKKRERVGDGKWKVYIGSAVCLVRVKSICENEPGRLRSEFDCSKVFDRPLRAMKAVKCTILATL